MIGKWVETELGGYACPNCNHTIYCCSLKDEPFALPNYCPKCGQNMKEDTMRVNYNGFTGELVKLEKTFCNPKTYDLAIYDSEKNVTHSFNGVKLEDVKFLGGTVVFGG